MLSQCAADAYIINRENGPLYIRTNDTNRIAILAGGNIGLGTNTPRANLVVQGNSATSSTLGVDNVSGSSTLDISALGATYNAHGVTACTVWFYSPDDINIGGATNNCNDIRFVSNGALNMVIDGENRTVGIGTAAPSQKLSILDTTNTGSHNVVSIFHDRGSSNVSNGDFAYIKFMQRTNNASGSVQSLIGQIGENLTHSSRTSALAFWTENVGTVAEKMRIDSQGRVGIGTTAPVCNGLEIYFAAAPTLRLNDGGEYKGAIKLNGG